MPRASNVGVVRMSWAAAHENDVDALVSLTAHDVDWRPTAVAAPGLRGREALRDYLDGLRAAGRLVDAHRSRRSATASSSVACCAYGVTMAAWRRSSAGGSIAWPAARSPRPAATPAAATPCATPATNRRTATRRTAARDRRARGLVCCRAVAERVEDGRHARASRHETGARRLCRGRWLRLVDLVVTSDARPPASDYHRRRLRAQPAEQQRPRRFLCASVGSLVLGGSQGGPCVSHAAGD
jgi:hypothetical protein